MKSLITALLICFSLFAYSQTNTQLIAIKTGYFFAAGCLDGLHDKIDFRYDDFKRLFPEAKDQFCNPDISWRNKYKNGDPLQGEVFWQSSRMFVCATDLFHLTNTGRTFLCVVGAAIPLNGKITLKELAVQAVVYLVAYNTGKYIVYELK